MDKSLILIIILCILGIFVAIGNTEIIHDKLNDVKIILHGEENQKSIANINNIENNTKEENKSSQTINKTIDTNNNNTNTNDKNFKNLKVYNKNGIYFEYPSYWNYDQLNKLFSLYKKEYISRWDDGIIFYISDNSLEKELKIKQETDRYKHPKNITIDGKKAYSLSDTKADYWHYLVIVEKNSNESYIFTFYCDQELKKEDKKLFDQILETMQLH